MCVISTRHDSKCGFDKYANFTHVMKHVIRVASVKLKLRHILLFRSSPSHYSLRVHRKIASFNLAFHTRWAELRSISNLLLVRHGYMSVVYFMFAVLPRLQCHDTLSLRQKTLCDVPSCVGAAHRVISKGISYVYPNFLSFGAVLLQYSWCI